MNKKALGLIETVGLAAAIEAADTCLKSANVELIGYELTKGFGLVTVKIRGDVGAVKAALEASKISASRVNEVYSTLILPRPVESLDSIIESDSTVGIKKNQEEVHEEIQKVELKLEETKETKINNSESLNEDEVSEVCNICHDPNCRRKKGQPRTLCIHYKMA